MHRSIIIPALILLALFLERGASYGVNVSYALYLAEKALLGTTDRTYLNLLSAAGAMIAPLIGGVVAIAIGPRITMTLGALAYAVGYGALALDMDVSLWSGTVLTVLGLGLFRPAAFVALAHELGYPQEAPRLAAFALAYAATNIAGFGAAGTERLLRATGDVTLVFGLAAGAMVLASVLGTSVVGVHRRLGDKPTRADFGRRAEFGALALVALTVPFYVGLKAHTRMWDVVGSTPDDYETLFQASIIGVIAASSLLAAGTAIAAVKNPPPMTLPLIGGGMIISSLGFGLAVFADPVDVDALMPSVVVMAVAETLVGAVVLSRITADTHPRYATLFYALLSLLFGATNVPIAFIDDVETFQLVLGGAALTTLVSGVVTMGLANRMQRHFFTPKEES